MTRGSTSNESPGTKATGRFSGSVPWIRGRARQLPDRRAGALRPDVQGRRNADRPGREPGALLAIGRCAAFAQGAVPLEQEGVKKPLPGEPWQVAETPAAGTAARRRRSRSRPRPDRERTVATMSATPPLSHRRADVVSRPFRRFLEPEHSSSGDREGAGPDRAMGHSLLGRGEAQAGRRSAVRRRAGDGLDGPAGGRGDRGGRAARPSRPADWSMLSPQGRRLDQAHVVASWPWNLD